MPKTNHMSSPRCTRIAASSAMDLSAGPYLALPCSTSLDPEFMCATSMRMDLRKKRRPWNRYREDNSMEMQQVFARAVILYERGKFAEALTLFLKVAAAGGKLAKQAERYVQRITREISPGSIGKTAARHTARKVNNAQPTARDKVT